MTRRHLMVALGAMLGAACATGAGCFGSSDTCGNGKWDRGEECDPNTNYNDMCGYCQSDCTWSDPTCGRVCGDGVCDWTEYNSCPEDCAPRQDAGADSGIDAGLPGDGGAAVDAATSDAAGAGGG